VQDYLTPTRGIAAERVFLVAPKAGGDGGTGGKGESGEALPASRAEFTLR
jgi:hypothetical protein